MTFLLFSAILVIGLMLICGVYYSYAGSVSAKVFLWSWAGLLLVCIPFIDSGPSFFMRFLPLAAIGLVVLAVYTLRNWSTDNEIAAAREETRRVLAEMNNRIDAERKHMAGRLHDDVNHKLLEAKMYLRRLRPILEKNIADQKAAEIAQSIVINALDLIYDTYIECRDIIKNTRVEIIESIGIVAAITDMVSQYKAVLQRPRLSFEHVIPNGLEPSGEDAVNIYRLVQEAVLNIVKHAKAQNAKIRFYYRSKDMSYVVVVEDDGEGIAPKRTTGIGMIDMRERARAIGGDLKVTSRSRRGTRITVKFKRHQEEAMTQWPGGPLHPGDSTPSEAHF